MSAREAGVPVLPASGAVSIEDEEGLLAHAAEVGYPLLVKLSAGGGGIGMTRVEEERKKNKPKPKPKPVPKVPDATDVEGAEAARAHATQVRP